MYIPEEGGIHPREAARHHSDTFPLLFEKAFQEAKLKPNDISLVSYARGPGLGPVSEQELLQPELLLTLMIFPLLE